MRALLSDLAQRVLNVFHSLQCCRSKDPVYGCVAAIALLQQQIVTIQVGVLARCSFQKRAIEPTLLALMSFDKRLTVVDRCLHVCKQTRVLPVFRILKAMFYCYEALIVSVL